LRYDPRMLTRRAFLALPAVLLRQPESPHEARIREVAASLAELIRPRPRAFLHYHQNKFDIWVAATHLKLTIRDSGMHARWRRHYRVADAVAKDMAHAQWECYPGCRHCRAHEFAERIIDSGEDWRWDSEVVS
jgi:hypothetical protein